MRLLLDTNIVYFMAAERHSLNRDVLVMLNDYDNQLYTSAETVRELIVAYRNKGLGNKIWKDESGIITNVEEMMITIQPVTREHIKTYAQLTLNEAEGHKDPSDHIIIAHAMTEKMTLISSDTRFPFYRAQGLDLIMNPR